MAYDVEDLNREMAKRTYFVGDEKREDGDLAAENARLRDMLISAAGGAGVHNRCADF